MFLPLLWLSAFGLVLADTLSGYQGKRTCHCQGTKYGQNRASLSKEWFNPKSQHEMTWDTTLQGTKGKNLFSTTKRKTTLFNDEKAIVWWNRREVNGFISPMHALTDVGDVCTLYTETEFPDGNPIGKFKVVGTPYEQGIWILESIHENKELRPVPSTATDIAWAPTPSTRTRYGQDPDRTDWEEDKDIIEFISDDPEEQSERESTESERKIKEEEAELQDYLRISQSAGDSLHPRTGYASFTRNKKPSTGFIGQQYDVWIIDENGQNKGYLDRGAWRGRTYHFYDMDLPIMKFLGREYGPENYMGQYAFSHRHPSGIPVFRKVNSMVR
jgi:hypothetical protein